MKTILLYAAIILLILSCTSTLPVPPETTHLYARVNETSWLQTEGRNIVNEAGDPILLKGLVVNSDVWGDWIEGVSQELMDSGKDPLIRPKRFDSWALEDKDFTVLDELGLNVVRYSIAYEHFMPENPYREENLAKLISDTKRFNELDIYVIPALQAPPGLDVQNEYYEDNYHGDERIQNLIESDEYFAQAVEMWEYLATALKDMPGIAGYEITNEPRMPCDAQGGAKLYSSRLSDLCRSIRQIDPRHIIFVPEHNSREANPGERYWNNLLEKEVTDSGEQGAIWEQAFVKMEDDIDNIVYVFHTYTPYYFTHDGQPYIDRNEMTKVVEKRVSWAKEVANAPLICTEFGANWRQPVAKRTAWAKHMFDLLDTHGISATYYNYKAVLDPFNYPFHLYGIYGEYVDMEEQMAIYVDSYSYRYSWLEEAAMTSNFDETFKTWLWEKRNSEGTVPTFTQLDHAPLLQAIKEYFIR